MSQPGPQPTLHTRRTRFKHDGAQLQLIGLAVDDIQPLAPLQRLVDIRSHRGAHTLHLGFHLADLIDAAEVAILGGDASQHGFAPSAQAVLFATRAECLSKITHKLFL